MTQQQIGVILKSTTNYATVIIPYHCFHLKYKKMQIKIKKYSTLNYKNECIKGDFVLFDTVNNKILTFFK